MYRHIEESQTLLINTQSQVLEAQKKEIIKFGFGQSPFLPPEFVIDSLTKATYHKEYSSVQGDAQLRENISKFHEKHNGLVIKPENILIAPGSKILLFSILMAFEKADVLIPAPAWVSYEPQTKLAGHNSIHLATKYEERWRVTSATIREATKRKEHKTTIMILNYPGNPDGLTYTEQELIEIAKVAREMDILVISDEIYGLLTYSGDHHSFAKYYPEKTITTTGLSKWCGAGGWRLGVAMLYDTVAPEFKKALIGIASETYSCAPTPVQIAARTAYKDFELIKSYLTYQNEILYKIGIFCTEKLNASNIKVHEPQGGFYIFPDFSTHKEALAKKGILTSIQLCEQLLKDTGVAILPATAFGFEEKYLAARLAFVDFETPGIGKEFDLNRDCPKVVSGIQKICDWITAM
ncbi:pyridoxal phosphate-dependent aminotransferase [Aquimarina rhabdastrellae]